MVVRGVLVAEPAILGTGAGKCAWWIVPVRGAGWAFTLLCSAWLHVLPLAAGDLLNASAAPIDGLGQRLALMGRALGWR